MNLDLCKSCPFCEIFPKPGAPLSDQKRKHYHCLKAIPSDNIHTQENPTPFIAEEFDERRVNPNQKEKLVIEHVVRVKPEFRVPATCPRRNEH